MGLSARRCTRARAHPAARRSLMAYRERGATGDRVQPPGPSPVDLHTHTNRSDGILEPAELVAGAAAAGVKTLAITDHDTLAAPPAASEAAGRLNVDLIPGIEINTIADDADGFQEGELHLLGYGVDPAHGALQAALDLHRQQRRRRFWLIVQRLQELGLPIDDVVRDAP